MKKIKYINKITLKITNTELEMGVKGGIISFPSWILFTGGGAGLRHPWPRATRFLQILSLIDSNN